MADENTAVINENNPTDTIAPIIEKDETQAVYDPFFIENEEDEDFVLAEPEARVRRPKINRLKTVSGMIVDMKKYTPKSRKIFSGETKPVKGQKARENVSLLLDEYVVDIIDPGIYATGKCKGFAGKEFPVIENGSLNWNYILSGDRIDLIIQNAIATYGPYFSYDMTCPFCKKDQVAIADIRKLKRWILNDRSKATYLAGNEFQYFLQDENIKVNFGLSTGFNEINVIKMRRNGGLADEDISRIAQQITLIPGVNRTDFAEFLSDVSDDDFSELEAEMERVDCGVDTEVSPKCERCKKEMPHTLPFAAGFIGRHQRTLRARRSKSAGLSL